MLKFPFKKGLKLYRNEIIPFAFSPSSRKHDQNLGSTQNLYHNPLNYFKSFLNFGYFFYYIPFRLTRVKNTKVYMIKSSSLHKVICLIVHILSFLRFTMSIRKIINSYRDPSPSPVLYFEICRSILTWLYMVVFKWTFWTKSKLFCMIVNDLANTKISNSRLTYFGNHRMKVTTLATTICFLYSVIPICNVILGSEVINIKNLEFSQLVEAYAGMARYTFFIQNTTKSYPIKNFNFVTYLLTPTYVVMNFYYFLGGHFFDLSVLMGALTLRHLSGIFSDTVNDCKDPYYINMLLKEYASLKDFSKKINGAINGIAFCLIVEALPYYATHFDDILTLDDWYDRFRYMFYVVNFLSILIIASDIIVKVDSLRLWLSKENNCLTLPSTKVVVLINELSHSPVGITPGLITTITYGFIGTIVSVVVTYAVIILQFNFASNHGCPTINQSNTPDILATPNPFLFEA